MGGDHMSRTSGARPAPRVSARLSGSWSHGEGGGKGPSLACGLCLWSGLKCPAAPGRTLVYGSVGTGSGAPITGHPRKFSTWRKVNAAPSLEWGAGPRPPNGFPRVRLSGWPWKGWPRAGKGAFVVVGGVMLETGIETSMRVVCYGRSHLCGLQWFLRETFFWWN